MRQCIGDLGDVLRSRIVCVISGLIAIVMAWSCSQPADPESAAFTLTAGTCVTDFSCPLGQECLDGTCAPIRPSLYPHIQTGVVLMRKPIDDAESAWLANHFDVIIGGAHPDEIRAVNPYARLFDYTVTRYHKFDVGEKTASDWALAHGFDPEDFYLHFREDVYIPTWEGKVIVPGFPPGMVPGWNPAGGGNPHSATTRSQSRVVGYYQGNDGDPWYFANVAHPGFQQFLADRTAGLIDGTWYFDRPFATGPLEGIMCDMPIWYAQFGEGLLDHSTEYYGIPLTDDHPYAIAHENLFPYLSASLMNQLGNTVDVMPNYGHVLYLNYPNRSAVNIQTTTPWILGEVWVTFTGTSSPVSGSSRCITFDKDYVNAVAKIVGADA